MPTKQVDYLEFANKGEVPVNAFKLLGASSKRNDDSKIGYFGTGLKYSLAVLIREQIEFKIFSGAKEVKIGTRKTKFLDQQITVITVNGEKTSITVEAGINWEPWFAIREIYSNNLDEGGKMALSTQLKPQAGYTKIYIKKDQKLQNLINNWSGYFSNTRTVLFSNDEYALLEKNNHQFLTVFRRGICVYQNRKPSLFDYDIHQIGINESRVVEHDYTARQRCAETLALCANEDALKKFIRSDDTYIEKDSDFWTYLFDEFRMKYSGFSDTWFEVLKDKRIVPQEYAGFYGQTNDSVLFPENLCKHLYKHFGDKLQIMGKTQESYLILEDESTDFLKPAMKELEKVGFAVPMNIVHIVRFKDSGVLGLADKGQVLLSEKLKTITYQAQVLPALFEEIAHLKSDCSDNTREFQDYIINITCALVRAIPEKAEKPKKLT